MASGPIVGGDDGPKEKQRYTENKVYTRKAFKGPRNKANTLNAVAPPSTTAPTATTTTNENKDNKNNSDENNTNNKDNPTTNTVEKNNSDEPKNNTNDVSTQPPPRVTEDGNSTQPQVNSRLDIVSDDSTSLNRQQDEPGSPNRQPDAACAAQDMPSGNSVPDAAPGNGDAEADPRTRDMPSENGVLDAAPGNGDAEAAPRTRDMPSENGVLDAAPSTRDMPSGNSILEPGSENRVTINVAMRSKQEVRELRRKLERELVTVRSLVKRIEEKQGQIGEYANSNVMISDGIDKGGGAKRVHSEVASVGVPRESTRSLHQISVPVVENNQAITENVEKEKRTPKANQFYRNSEFLLAKDKFPPAESNKKSKLNGRKQVGGDMGHGYWMGSKFFKSCSSLLEKLMKHKHGWVFNAPVDVEGLNLHDYFTIITHPMDLGTVKTRLNKNWYKSPKEFAEDVRLTFRNAMIYNPKGQDVHVMAEQLLKIFEDRWAIIESDYNREMRYGIDYGGALPTPSPLSRKAPPFLPPPLDMRRILDRTESMTHTPRPMSITPSSRTPAPKKPKAKDPNKRDMTYDEKQKLSANLQNLPSEKLDAIVQIIKKRNSALSQHDDEIEVDIDSVDAETLWELDRFVTNYKKSLSKNKRKAEIAIARKAARQNAAQMSQAPVMVEVPNETRTDEMNILPSLPAQEDKPMDDGSRSSSSSSSSSDSGSSSSDSDSESSSASGSDAGSPRS